MKKTITVLAYNRPALLEQCLAALTKCRGVDGYRVHVSLDGGADVDNIAVVQKCLGTSLHGEIQVYDQNLGIDHHNAAAYDAVFGLDEHPEMSYHSDFNVALEDDAVLSPDALELAEWFQNYPGYICCSLGGDPVKTYGPPDVVVDSQTLCSSAWMFTRNAWEVMRPHWNRPLRTQLGWDWSIAYAMHEHGWIALSPRLSRSKNIGREGIHSFPEWFDEHIAGNAVSDGTPANFRIIPTVLFETPEWIKQEDAATEDRYAHLRNK